MRFTKRKGLTALGIIACLAIAGGAYAYWTGGGSGSGEGTVDGGGTVTLTGTVADGSSPGNAVPVSFTAGNAGDSAVMVDTVTLQDISTDSEHDACVVGDFSMAPVAENHSVPAGATAEALPVNGSLAYADTGVSQDACKGAILTLALTSN